MTDNQLGTRLAPNDSARSYPERSAVHVAILGAFVAHLTLRDSRKDRRDRHRRAVGHNLCTRLRRRSLLHCHRVKFSVEIWSLLLAWIGISLTAAGCATIGKSGVTGDGISVGDPETFDNTFFQTQLIALRSQLMSLQTLDQSSLTKAIGGLQGGQLQQSGVNFQVLGQATPQVVTTSPAFSTVTPTSTDTKVSTQSALTPSVPSVAPSTLTLPSGFAGSTLDILSEQMQLSSQVLNYEMLLSGSNYAKFGPSGDAKTELTIGFPITLEPPTAEHKDDIADIEVTYCFATPKEAPPAVVNLLPTDNTYNVLTLTDRSQSFGLGVIAGVFSVGGGYSGSTKTEYLIKQQDTVALRRNYDLTADECRGGIDGGAANSDSQGKTPANKTAAVPEKPTNQTQTAKTDSNSYSGTTFAWQFRPILGEHFVRSGIRQTFVQVAVPGSLDAIRTAGAAITSLATTSTSGSGTATASSTTDTSTTGTSATGAGTSTTGPNDPQTLKILSFTLSGPSEKFSSYYVSNTDESIECEHGNEDMPSDFTLKPQLTNDNPGADNRTPSGFVVVKMRWIHLDPTSGVTAIPTAGPAKPSRLPVRGRFSDLPWLASCIKSRDLGGGNLWVRVGGAHIDGTRVRVGTSLLDSSSPGFKTFDNSVEFVAPALSIANGGAYLVAPSGRETAIYPRANQTKQPIASPDIVPVPNEILKITKVALSPIDNASSLVELSVSRSSPTLVPTIRPLVVLAAGKLYGLSDSPFVGEEDIPSKAAPTAITLRLIAANTALNANPSVSVQRLFSGQSPVPAAILPPGSISIAPLPAPAGAAHVSAALKTCKAPGRCLMTGYLPIDGHLDVTAIGGCNPHLTTGVGTSRVVDLTGCGQTLQQLTFLTKDTVANLEQDLTVSVTGNQPAAAASSALAATVPDGSVAPHFALNRAVGNIQMSNGTALLTVSVQNLKDPAATVTVTNADVSSVVDGTGKALTLTGIGQVTVSQDSTLTFQLTNCCSSKVTVTAEGKSGTISTGKWSLDFSSVRESAPKQNDKPAK